MRATLATLVLVLVSSAGGCAASGARQAATVDETQTRGQALLASKLRMLPGADQRQAIPIPDEAVARVFPGYLFYVVRFPQYPIARVPPAPLAANNIFVVEPDDTVVHLPDPKALESFFRSKLPPVKTDTQAKEATIAWLRLLQEFHQDGFLEFSIPEESVKVVPTPSGGREVIGQVVVTPRGGNRGEIVASLTFDSSGRLVSVSESAAIKRGIRPICQAARLLDPDPIVRGMAEQAILTMGKAAREYLDEQRALASPALAKAIDRLWQRILTEER